MTSLDLPVSKRPAQMTSRRPLVVVIEDDYRSSLALTMLIDDWGFSPLAARCAREVVRTLGHHRIDDYWRTHRVTGLPWPNA